MQTQGLTGQGAARPPTFLDTGLERDVQAHLGRQLRALYDEVAGQPVPDRFLKLLEQLEQREAEERDARPARDDS